MLKFFRFLTIICGIALPFLSFAADIFLPLESGKNVVFEHSRAPRYLAFDAVINTRGKYTSGGAWALAIRLNDHALLASELVNRPFTVNYKSNRLHCIDDGGRLFLPYASPSGKNRISRSFVFKVDNLAKTGKNTLQLTNIYNFHPDSQVEISNLRWLDILPADSKTMLPQVKNQRLANFISIPLQGRKVITVEKNPDRLSYLAFSGRIETAKWRSGAQPALIIRVNGQSIRGERLKNKSPYFHFRADSYFEWVTNDRINLGYYPLHRVKRTIDGHFIHDFVFDLNGLWKKDAPNVIELENVFAAFPDSSIQLFDLRLTDSNFLRSKLAGEQLLSSCGLATLRNRAGGLHAGVNKKFNTPPEKLPASAPIDFVPGQSVPLPYEYIVGQTALTIKNAGAQTGLTTSFKVRSQSAFLQNNELKTPHLEVKRTIERSDNALIIRDRMTNLTGSDLPVVYDYCFDLPLDKLQEFRIAGEAQKNFNASTSNLAERKYSQLPLIYLGFQQSALAIYIADDILRNHYSLITVDGQLHIADDIFYLPPHRSHTVELRIYSTPDNYYDCLNILRKDLNLYQEIPGLFGFVYKFPQSDHFERYYRKKLDSPEKIRQFFAESGINIPSSTGAPMLYGSEKNSEWQQALNAYDQFKRDIIAADVPVKAFLHYCDVHLVAVNKDNDLDGKTLWQERLRDSVMLNARGQTVPYRSGRLYHVVPTLENTAGRQIKENIAFILNKHPLNGIFFDEFNHSRARIAWNMSDDCSALLDQNGNITRKFAIVPLKSQAFLLDIARFATRNGRIAYANQFDSTLQLMQLPLVHFAEPVAHEESYLIRAAQGSRTPLTLSCKRNTTVWGDIKYFLQYGVAVCYYASRSYGDHLLHKLYPLTIYEVQPGMIYGKDKLLTGRSGKYTLPEAGKLTVYIYRDPDGMLAKTFSVKGNTVTLQLDSSCEVALITAGD